MSLLEVVDTQVFAVDLTVALGVLAPAVRTNYNGASKLLSIVRTVVSGTVGDPKCATAQPSGAGVLAVYGLGLFTGNALDNSTYRVFWTNQYIASPNYIQGGATANAQFAP